VEGLNFVIWEQVLCSDQPRPDMELGHWVTGSQNVTQFLVWPRLQLMCSI